MANLSNCLKPDYEGPPADVTFKFTDESGVVRKVKAHKLILAIASDVFNREFFGSMKAEDEIDIVDASQEVFQALVDSIYNKQPDLKKHDISDLCSLYNLAEKYNLDYLINEILVVIHAHKFTYAYESLIKFGLIAEEFKHHRPLYEALYNAAAGFLFREFNGSLDEAVNLFREYEGINEKSFVFFKLLAYMVDIKRNSSPCKNCKRYLCLNDKGITLSNFIPGAKVNPRLGTVGIESMIRLENREGDTDYWFVGKFKFKDGSERVCAVHPDYYVYNCV